MLPNTGEIADVLVAFRTEIGRRPAGAILAPEDGVWVIVGTVLGHAAYLPARERAHALEAVGEQLRALLGDELWERGLPVDPVPPPDASTLAPRIRVLCEKVEDADAALLADAIVRAYLASGDSIENIELGRFDALRGRLAWKRGDHELAEAHYRRVAIRADALGSAELTVRASLGAAVLARLRGNYPESRIAGAQAVAVAEAHGFLRLAALGHHALMVAAAMARHWDVAIAHAWRAYQAVRGDAVAEGAQLSDIAQLFFDAGHHEAAAAGFAAALRQPLPTRLMLPTLGGAALTAARAGQIAELESYASQTHLHADCCALPYATVSAWLDVAEAHLIVGDVAQGDALRQRALKTATAFAYHELQHRAAELAGRTRLRDRHQASFSDDSREIEQSVRALAGSVH